MPIKNEIRDEYRRQFIEAVLATFTIEEIRQLILEMERKAYTLH
jgi:hypothetical protein